METSWKLCMPIGAGNEVGRFGVILKYKGRTIMGMKLKLHLISFS